MSARLLHSGIKVTDEQRNIVEHLQQDPVTVVNAGAGAGKTYTTVAAVVELIAGGHAQADSFVLITFTNQAADELRARLQSEMARQLRDAPDPARRTIWLEQRERLSACFIGTIHRFCKQVLDLYGYSQGVARKASVSLSARLVKEAVDKSARGLLLPITDDPVAALVHQGTWPEYELRKFLERLLSDARSRGIDIAAMFAATQAQADDAGKEMRVRFAQLLVDIERSYMDASRSEHQLDAAALLLEVDKLLASPEGPAAIERLAQRFRYLFIDEFQDTSETQARIASALVGRLNVMVVGDGKQAIYAFAGASQSLLLRFARQHRTDPLPLRLSGRPSKPLLAVQTELFQSIDSRFPGFDQPLLPSDRNLEPSDSLPPCVTLMARQDDDHAVEHAVHRIRNILGQAMDQGEGPRAIEPADIAVLVRTNSEATLWAQALQEAGVPARSEGGAPLLQRPEVVGMYRFLQVLARYPDDVALAEALAAPFFAGVDLDGAQTRILSYGFQRGTPLSDEFENRYPERAQLLRRLCTESLTATVPDLLGRIEQAYQLKRHYREAGDAAAALTLDRLRDYARQCFDSDEALTLRIFLDMLRRAIMSEMELRQPAGASDARPAHIRVMTIHRAKGMEFPIVVVPGLEENRLRSMPPDYILDPEHGLEVNLYRLGIETASEMFWKHVHEGKKRALAEEMRLFYVAVTRAERLLVLLGRESTRPDDKDSKQHSWQDEVLEAKPAMQRCGARFARLYSS